MPIELELPQKNTLLPAAASHLLQRSLRVLQQIASLLNRKVAPSSATSTGRCSMWILKAWYWVGIGHWCQSDGRATPSVRMTMKKEDPTSKTATFQEYVIGFAPPRPPALRNSWFRSPSLASSLPSSRAKPAVEVRGGGRVQ